MTVARPVRLTAAVVLTGVVLAGCGEAAQQAAQKVGLTPAARVDAAVSSLLDTDRLTVTAQLDLDDANRAALVALAGDDEVLTDAALERVLGTRLVATTVATEGQLSDVSLSWAADAVPTTSTSVAVEVEGATLAEARQVGTTVYARADLPAIEAAYGIEGMTDELTAGTDQAPGEVAGALDALVAGRWVSLDTADLTAQLQEQGLAAPAPDPTDADRAGAAVEDFLSEAAAVLRREVVVTETGADAYEVTAPLDKVLTSLTPSLTSLVGELATTTGVVPGAEGTDPDELVQGVTEGVQEALEGLQDDLAGRTATVEVGLDGDRLASARFDVVQLVDEDTRADMAADDVTALPVLITFAHEGEVAAPEGATAIDLEALMGGFDGGGLAGLPLGGLVGGGSVVPVPGTVEDPRFDDEAPGEMYEATLEELAETGLTPEAMGVTEEEFVANLAEMGIVVVP